MKTVLLLVLLLFSSACPARAEGGEKVEAAPEKVEATSETVKRWVAQWGDKWSERYHPDYQAEYPGGRSNRYHDAYLKEVFRKTDWPTNTNWKIINKTYSYEGDWFVVEWLFQAEDRKTGKLQREGTLAFGRIDDDQLIIWIEYFDGFVAHLQRAEALPLFGENDEPFPWPDDAATARHYRP